MSPETRNVTCEGDASRPRDTRHALAAVGNRKKRKKRKKKERESEAGCRASVDFALSEWSRGGCMVYEDDVKGFCLPRDTRRPERGRLRARAVAKFTPCDVFSRGRLSM